jgi:hypothetical protein
VQELIQVLTEYPLDTDRPDRPEVWAGVKGENVGW